METQTTNNRKNAQSSANKNQGENDQEGPRFSRPEWIVAGAVSLSIAGMGVSNFIELVKELKSGHVGPRSGFRQEDSKPDISIPSIFEDLALPKLFKSK